MMHLDDEEERLLQAARRGFSPAESDLARVLSATQTALAVDGDAASTAPPAASRTLGFGTLARPWLARTAIGLADHRTWGRDRLRHRISRGAGEFVDVASGLGCADNPAGHIGRERAERCRDLGRRR